jgi:hypothetical protein
MHGVELFLRAAVRQALVQRQALVHVVAIGFGQERRRVQLDLGGRIQRLVEVDRLAGLERAHRALEHARIEVEADFLYLARLRFAQHFAGAANLQVVHREVEAGAELFHHLNCFKAFLCLYSNESSEGTNK